MTTTRPLEVAGAAVVAYQVIVLVAVWLLDPLILSSQRNIGILLASSVMLYGALCQLYLINPGVLSRNLQWTAAAVGASFAMLVFMLFPYM